MLTRFLFALLSIILVVDYAQAEECSAVFTNGLQNNNDSGTINFQYHAQLKNSASSVLDSSNAINDGSGWNWDSCDNNGPCTNSGKPAVAIIKNNFPNGNNVTVAYQQALTLAPGSYNNITLDSESTLNVSAGDYTFNGNFSAGDKSTINIVGAGVVRIFVKLTMQFNTKASINSAGSATNLLLYADENIIIVSDANVTAFIYSKKDVTLNSIAEVNGAISGKNITLISEAIVNFESMVPNFGDFCGGAPIANYRLDECSYNGTAFEVIDQTGTYPATAFSSLNTDIDGQIERFANISDENHHIETAIPVPTNFSVSTWFKKPTSSSGNRYFVLGAMENGGDLLYLDRKNDLEWGVYDGFNSVDGGFAFDTLDDNWHHLTLVYSAGQTQLYIDGDFKEALGRKPTGTLKYIGTSFDEINGNNPQGFRAPLDEFLVYDKSLTASDIAIIYNFQLAKKNFDGSARDPVLCSPFLAFYQFEQTDFTTQIDDTSGLGNHAENIFGGLSTADGKYCRGFESESWNDYNGITDAFRAGVDLNNNVGLQGTISFWFNSRIDWNQGQERVLFDASAGSSSTDKYFVFEIQQDGRLKFAFEDSSDADFNLVEPSIISRDADTWYYLTVTWDYVANDFVIYVDGTIQVQQTKSTNGAMGELERIVFGDNSSDYTQTGNSPVASPYSSRGNYDEVRIYNKVLTQSEIQTDMNEDFGCLASLVAEWRMDEVVWSGISNDVLDELGNLPGRAYNDVITDRTNPARVGNPGTCGYGEFDGIDDYVQIDDDASLDLLSGLTVSAWIYPRSLPSGNSLKSIVSKDTNYEFHLNSQGEIFWWWDTQSFETSGANISANNWYHVAITYRSGEQSIYVNGVDYGSRTYEGDLPLNSNPLQIGQDQGLSSRFFHGRIDEVKIFDGALNAAEVFAIYQETHPCDVYIDHFEIDTLDQMGITCQTDEIIIKACADASCSTVNPDAVDVKLTINNAPYKTVTVAGINGTTTSYPFTTVGTASLSLDQTYDCTNTLGTTPCNVVFKDSGFIFSDIPMQISGKPSNTGFNTATLSLKAVETNTDTGVCQGTFPDNTDVEVDLSYSCDSGLCSNDLALTNNNNQYSLNTILSPYILRFDNDSTAFFSINYPDAGRLILNAQKDVELEDNDGNKVIKDFSGSSSPFVERPFGFFINAIDNPKAQSAGDDKYKKAGELFTVQLSSVVWQSVDDQNNDAIPDIGADLSDNDVTVNFGNEATPETAVISHGLVAPLSGILGDLATSSFIFNNGIAADPNVSYSEVGIINLSANLTADNEYLGTSDVQGNEPFVGRFTPDHFDLTLVSDGLLASVCDGGDPDMPFAYNAQMSSLGSVKGALQYLDKPEFIITAKSSVCLSGACSTTRNYFDDFMKLEVSGVKKFKVDDGTGNMVFFPIVDGTRNGVDNTNKVKLTVNYTNGTLTPRVTPNLGSLTFTYSDQDNFVYSREENSEIPPFDSDINLSISSITDGDLITANDFDSDPDGTGPILASDTIITLHPTGKEIRFGRAYLKNSFGPETENLPQPFYLQYLKTVGNYETVIDDTCTQWDASKITLMTRTLDKTKTSSAGGSGFFNAELPNGETRAMFLTEPDPTGQGEVGVEYDIAPWLKYDWTGDGNFTDNPSAIATFGIFRGNDRIIYQREIQR